MEHSLLFSSDNLGYEALLILFSAIFTNDFFEANLTSFNRFLRRKHLQLSYEGTSEVPEQIKIGTLLRLKPKHFIVCLPSVLSWLVDEHGKGDGRGDEFGHLVFVYLIEERYVNTLTADTEINHALLCQSAHLFDFLVSFI